MAPHWKCGLGQPIAGSKSRPLRHSPRVAGRRACVGACAPRSRTCECARSGPRLRLRLNAPAARGRKAADRRARRRRGPERVSFRGRARRGTSGALYLQSAPAGLNPLPRSPFSDAARRATLRTGSRAAANREPCQVRKEAALSDHRRVPRNGLVRAARHGGHGLRSGRRRVHGISTSPARVRPEEVVTPTVPHQALYRRWRAQTFGEIVGQTAVVETLRNAVRQDRVGHAILFVGPRGTGKTSLARILAKAVNCTDLQDGDACDRCPSCVSIREGTTLDLTEIDAASNRGIDDVRGLRERLPIRRPAAQEGLHPRRGPPDHRPGLERAPQVDRGTARLRHLHVRLDRAIELPAGDPVASPALRRPPADRRRDRGQARPDPRRRRPAGRPGAH